MPEPLPPLEFLSVLERRWKRIAAVAACAAAIAFVVSLLLPKQYESTTLLLIQPAANGSAAVMSPAYLDSLRSYEQFVESDGVLENLLRDTHLNGEFSGERFRRAALRAMLVKGTRILQISVRLGDPQKAHEAALRLAQIVVESNTRINRDEATRTRGGADRDAEEAHQAMAAAQAAIDKFRSGSREDEITRDVEQQIERKVRYERELSDVQLDLAENEARASAAPGDQAARSEVAGLRARREALRGTLAALEKELTKSQAVHAAVEARRKALDGEYQAAEKRFSALASRATETASSVAIRREELEIADPGTVPTQPVGPHPVQNAILAAMLGLLAAVLYETWVWNAARVANPAERADRRPTAARW
jgi:uncharacterized protein involved in exopolysaccharide biosynthesis